MESCEKVCAITVNEGRKIIDIFSGGIPYIYPEPQMFRKGDIKYLNGSLGNNPAEALNHSFRENIARGKYINIYTYIEKKRWSWNYENALKGDAQGEISGILPILLAEEMWIAKTFLWSLVVKLHKFSHFSWDLKTLENTWEFG